MKAKVISPYFDLKGLHKIGEIVETEELNQYLEEVRDDPVQEEKPKRRRKGEKHEPGRDD